MHLRKKGRSLLAKHNNERDSDGETLEGSAGLKARTAGSGWDCIPSASGHYGRASDGGMM